MKRGNKPKMQRGNKQIKPVTVNLSTSKPLTPISDTYTLDDRKSRLKVLKSYRRNSKAFINQKLIDRYGQITAMVLIAFIDEYIAKSKMGELTDDNEFALTMGRIQAVQGIREKSVGVSVLLLISDGVIIERERWYILNFKRLAKIIINGTDK